MARFSRGFTLLELMVVVCVVGLLAVTAIGRLLYYTEVAEKAGMEANVEAIQTGLRMQLAVLVASGQGARLADLQSANPMLWLQQRPATYAGEYGAQPRAGNWYYEADRHELVYLPKHHAYLAGEGAGSVPELRFHPVLSYDPATRRVADIRLQPIQPYTWF